MLTVFIHLQVTDNVFVASAHVNPVLWGIAVGVLPQ